MTNFNLIPGSNFTQQLLNGVRQQGSKKIFNKLAFNASKISNQIGDFLVEIFESTDVARSLRGNGIIDLPAHFGLSSSSANQLVSNMGDVIKRSVSLGTKLSQKGGVIQIRAIDNSFSQFLSLPNASYTSSPSNVTIPVMRWMLIDPDIDVGQAAYDIVFQGEGGSAIDITIQKKSRSGRAIMVTLEQLGGGSPYVLPSIVRGSAGKNFIEFVIRKQGVAEKAAQIVIAGVK